jgi:hypothetical protein
VGGTGTAKHTRKYSQLIKEEGLRLLTKVSTGQKHIPHTSGKAGTTLTCKRGHPLARHYGKEWLWGMGLQPPPGQSFRGPSLSPTRPDQPAHPGLDPHLGSPSLWVKFGGQRSVLGLTLDLLTVVLSPQQPVTGTPFLTPSLLPDLDKAGQLPATPGGIS